MINLALHSHEKALPDEAGSVAALGMTYVHIPVDFQNPTERDFAGFVTAMQAAQTAPVHVHCIANYRVSAFFYRYRRDVFWASTQQRRGSTSMRSGRRIPCGLPSSLHAVG